MAVIIDTNGILVWDFFALMQDIITSLSIKILKIQRLIVMLKLVV